MAAHSDRPPLASILRLATTWSIARRPVYRVAAISTILVYVLVAMLVGQMLIFIYPAPQQVASYWAILPSGQPWWNYPAFLLVTPGFTLTLPFFSTFAMLLVAFGVSLGMTSAVYLSVQLVRQRRVAKLGGTAGAGTVAGLSPALISLVTLGACCSTTAAALAGLAWTAAITGTTLEAVLVNNWYPGVFQIVILYVALLAQEQLLRTYGWVVGFSPIEPEGGGARIAPAGGVRRAYVSWALRAVLLVGGTTWLLALPAEWTAATAPAVTAPFVFQAAVEHVIPSIFAIGAALFPGRFLPRLTTGSARSAGVLLPRALATVAGASLLAWYPAAVVAQGASGWLNELLGVAGATSAWGAIPPPFGGLALAFRWTVQFAALGGFCLGVGLAPGRVGTLFGLPRSLSSARPGPLSSAGLGYDPDRLAPNRPVADAPEGP